jgi:hypothetical protein
VEQLGLDGLKAAPSETGAAHEAQGGGVGEGGSPGGQSSDIPVDLNRFLRDDEETRRRHAQWLGDYGPKHTRTVGREYDAEEAEADEKGKACPARLVACMGRCSRRSRLVLLTETDASRAKAMQDYVDEQFMKEEAALQERVAKGMTRSATRL